MRWHYPLLREVRGLYRETDLKDVLLLSCQHLLGSQYHMFGSLFQLGLKPNNCVVAGKSYSTNTRVYRQLSQAGCVMAPWQTEFLPDEPFDDWLHSHLTSFIGDELSRRQLQRYRKIIVLDDGGFLHEVCSEKLALCGNVAGVEQTSSGHARLASLVMPYDVLSVARWWHKQVREPPFIGEAACVRINEHCESRDKRNSRILVHGLGAIGRHVAGRLALVEGKDAFACDVDLPSVSQWGAVQRLQDARRVLSPEQALSRLGEFDVIIGATGSPVLSGTQVDDLHSEASLISLSSSDREFPAVLFRQGTGGGIHDDYYWGERCLVNGGFPITFYGNYHEIAPRKIEFTTALLMIGVLDSVSAEGVPIGVSVDRVYQMWNPE